MRGAIICLFLLVINAVAVPRGDVISYLKSERAAGRVPDMASQFGDRLWGTDMSGLDLSKVDFRHAELGDCKLIGCDLRGALLGNANVYLADFSKADFRGADLTDCAWDRCVLDGADFRNSKGFGHEVIMNVSAKGANFSGLDLTGKDISDIDFEHANLNGCNLSRANVEGSYFKDSNLTGVSAKELFFLNARLGTSLENISLLKQSGAITDRADMEAAIKHGVSFAKQNLRYARMERFHLNGADFTGADLGFANLTGCQISNTNFTAAKVYSTNFSSATLDQVKMTSVDAAGANFRDASLTEVNFLGAVVSYADFSNTRFIKTSFKSASVRNANFQTARGSTSPSLDVLRDESDYLWNKRTDALMEFLLSLAPIAGLFALFLLIITATMLHQRSPRPRWLWPCLTSYILALLFALLCFTSAMGSYSLLASILPLLAFLAVGPVITLFGCYLGIAKLAHGNKQRDWTAIFFFASAWLPPIAALAIMLQIIASAG